MPHSYLSLTALKAQLSDSLTADDATYRRELEAVSDEVDRITGRTFRVYLATKYFTARDARRLLLVDESGWHDLLAITTLKTDDTGDGTMDDTWDAADDYQLRPRNAPSSRAPYWEIAVPSDGGDHSFPVNVSDGVEIVGKWGYWEDLASNGTLNGALTDSATSVAMAAGHGLEALQTILIGSEQMYITAVATNTLTVERGVNGTTAAAHGDGATVRRYRYPSDVVKACAVLAEENLRPFGGHGDVDDTQQADRVMPRPHRVGELLAAIRAPVAA